MKEVKIIGLAVNKQLGILKACNMAFDENNRLNIIKGSVGQGKTTLKTALDLGTKGTKTLTDKSLYGDIDCETILLDGEQKIYVGCKSKDDGSIVYSLYIKDDNGKIVREPVIDGVKATPSKYLETLQTELTWRMDELVSENPVVQRKILLDLYKFELQKSGVIFDKNHPEYKDSILSQIEIATKERDYADMLRKQKGGIKEDLEMQGFDPDRPDICPDAVDIESIEKKINDLNTEIALSINNAANAKATALQAIQTQASAIIQKAKSYNEKVTLQFEIDKKDYESKVKVEKEKDNTIILANELLKKLNDIGYSGLEVTKWIANLEKSKIIPPISEPYLIQFNQDGKIVETENPSTEALVIFSELANIRNSYINKMENTIVIDNSEKQNELLMLNESKTKAIEINKIVEAIDSFHNWRKANENVQGLKKKYYNLLSGIETGVEGLKIVLDEKSEDIFLMYDGSFDSKYFGNENKELRKLSSYSGTQKPLICLLVQNFQLSKKPKALRYMYIDNVPMDKKTQEVIKNMCEQLNLRVFLNITGDFEKDSLLYGELLIEGGEVFFN